MWEVASVFLADFSLGDSLEQGFTELVEWLPNLIGALAVLVLGYFVAKIIGRLVRRALGRAGFDSWAHREPTGRWVQRIVAHPSNLLGDVAFWAVFLGAVSIAVDVLGIAALENLVASIYAYLPNVLAALAIFLVAVAIAGGLAALAQRFMGDTGLGRVVSTMAPILVMAIATFMILDQLKIAETIVTITYAGLIGALALGSALAFGLGGRDVAARMVEGAYATGQQKKEEFRRDLQLGIERAKVEAREKAQQLEDSQPEMASVDRDRPGGRTA
jgi:Conserved TM helix